MHCFRTCLLTFCLCALSWAADLSVTPGASGGGTLELKFSRMLTLDDGRIAILLGDVDATALFKPSGESWMLEDSPVGIPAGELPVRVYLVSLSGVWSEIASFRTVVRERELQSENIPSADSAPELPPAATQVSVARAALKPTLTLGYKSQRYSRFFPVESIPARPTFDDGNLQGTLSGEWRGETSTFAMNWGVAGATAASETLRFAEKGANAPHLDLSSYLLDFQWKGATFQMGHVQAGSSRHLMDNYASRGARIRAPLGKRADIALAQINGTQIVGWDNFFGLNTSRHQIGSATLGMELSPRAGGLRLELSALTGRLLPLTAFTQGALTDAERSVGGSVRLQASHPSQRLRMDAAFTRSAFTNPNDETLISFDETGTPIDIVPVRRETRGAYYIDAGADLLQNAFAASPKPVTLTLNYRGERVDPQFRSIAAQAQADRIQNQWELTGSAGMITASASYLRSHDNLLGLAALMRTSTRQSTANLSVPMSALWQKPPAFERWLPQFTYAYLGMRQFGTGNPLGFDSASQLPDQQNTNHNATFEWTLGQWRLGYRFNRSAQDNRQPGRELSDLINTVNTGSVGWTVGGLTTGFEAGFEDVFSRETQQTNRTVRLSSANTWVLRRGLTLLVNLSLTRLSQFGTISATRAFEGDTQLTWDLTRDSGAFRRAKPQLLLRYANRYQSIFDGVFLVDAITRAQTLQLGITLTLE